VDDFVAKLATLNASLMSNPNVPPSGKQSRELSQICLAYYQNVVKTNEIAR